MSSEKEIWEREIGESAKAYYAFALYRDLGPKDRSMLKVAQLYANKKTLISLMKRWSRKWKWVERAQAYDDHLDRLARLESEAELVEMRKKHIVLATSLQAKAADRLKDLNPQDLTPKQMIRALVEGVKLERLSRGETTETIAQQVEEKVIIKLWQPPKKTKEKKEAEQ